MRNKILLLMIGIFLVLVSSNFISAEDIGDVAYITRSTRYVDSNIVNAITELNHSIDFIEFSRLRTTNFSKYDMILVPNQKISSIYLNYIPVNKVNSLILNTYNIKTWHWAYDGTAHIASSQPLKANIILRNEISNNIPSPFRVYTVSKPDGVNLPMYYLPKNKKAPKIKGIVSTDTLDLVIASAEKGTLLRDGYVSDARGVFFGITEAKYWTADSKKLFQNSVEWLIGEENKAPVFSGPIPPQIWNENENLSLNLSRYFSDPENQTLIYNVYNTSQDVNIFVRIVGPIVYFNSTKDWFGTDWIIFKATDPKGLYAISNNISLIVLEKNISILELKINEFVSVVNTSKGEKEWVEIYNPTNASISLSNCSIKNGANNILNLNGNLNSKGFSAFDFTGSVLNDGGDIIKLYCYNNIIDSVTYGNWDDGNIGDNAIAPVNGESSGRYPDGKDTNIDKDDFRIFSTPTKGISNSVILDVIPPVVQLISPSNNSLFNNTRDVSFNFSASDNLAQTLACQIYLNNNVKGAKNIVNGSTGDFLLNNLQDNNYSWNIKCSDGFNNAFAPSDFIFSISAPNSPIFNQIGEKTVNENQTLQFTVSATDPDGDEINYSASNLPNGAIFNSSSRIFLWTPDFTQAGNYPVIFKATDSTNLSTSMTVNINVINVEIPPSFEDADTCSVVDNNIVVTIDKPDDGDDFEIGEDIEIKTEIENNGDEDIKLKIKVYLYDLDEDEVVEEESDSVKVKDGDSEKVELTINIPDDADTDNDFAIYAIAYKEKNEFCNSNFIEINIDKPDEKAVIKNFEISPEEVRGNEMVSFEVEVENIGNDDLKDIYVEIKNSELGLNIKSNKFDLDEDDEETINLDFAVPEDADKKTYKIEAGVVYDGKSDKETKNLIVLGEIKKTSGGTGGVGIVSTTGNLIYLDNKEPISLTKKTGTLDIISKDISVKEEIPEIRVSLSIPEEEKIVEKKVKTTGTFAEGIGFLIFGFFGVNTLLIFGIAIVLILIILVLIIKR